MNVLTVDVEDYFQVAAFFGNISTSDWEHIPSRVENNTNRLLDIIDSYGISSTFFILGWVAEKYPHIVKEIHNRGHEVASHGYSHQLIYQQTPEVFREETKQSKNILEDIIGDKVKGYRAASYSITKKSLWALDILVEEGFEYDSSIFPVHHDRYGIAGSPTEPHVLSTPSGYKLIEFPLTTYKFLNQSVPVAGGGYFRLYPYWLSRFFYRSLNKNSDEFVFYLHPWEIDPEQPRIKSNILSTFRHYNNLDKCEARLRKLLNEFEFTNMGEWLEQSDLYAPSTKPLTSY